MALVKTPVNINFSQGLDQKSDPRAIPIGKFYALNNSVFTKYGLLQKRNGFGPLTSLPDAASVYLTTFDESLVAIGDHLRSFSEGSNQWIDNGAFQPISFSRIPTVRSALSQTQCDSAIATNGLVCTVYTEISNVTNLYKYTVEDSATGQIIVGHTAIPAGAGTVTGSPRVFVLGGYFVIIFTNTISASVNLECIAISTASPSTLVQTHTTIAASYGANSTVSWDGVVVGPDLFIAYNTSSGGQKVEIASLTSGLVLNAATIFSASIATTMSMCADVSGTSPVIYAAFWDSAGTTGSAVAVNTALQKLMSDTQWLGSGSVANVTCTAQSGVLTIAYENVQNYSYDSAIPSNFISQNTITLPATVTTGTVGTDGIVVRSAGLASKAFLMNDTMYMLIEYSSVFQPTYLLCDLFGNLTATFAYQNGGGSFSASSGYLPTGLPQAQVIGSTVNVAYLYKDLITSVNKAQGAANAAGVYSQTGVNLASLEYSASTLSTSEIGNSLNLSGGYLYSFDGNIVTEQNFHVYPDNVESSIGTDIAIAGTVTSTSPTITAITPTGVVIGMNITGTGVPANTVVLAVAATTVTMSNNATGSHSSETITFTGNVSAQQYYYQVIYQWTDAQGNIFNSAPSIPVTATASSGHSFVTIAGPNLRLTNKPGVKIIIYRWSAAQQEYFQITSLSNPLLNDTTTDSWSYTDLSSDAQILGNGLIYTTGGVLENTGSPACTATTLFDTRLWFVYAEDQNLLGYSKQIIEGVPVEISDLLTFYVAPNAGATTSTGPVRCLAPMDDKLIIIKQNALYYINGSGPDSTGSNNQYSQPIFITSTVGSINQNSIVLIPQGLMFQSDKGIWLLGRDLQTSYIGSPVENSNEFTVTSAVTIPGTTQVRFTLNNKTTLMYDYFFQQWGTFVNLNGVSSTIYQNLHTYISSFGGVFQETPGLYMDNGAPVLMSFTTGWLNLAGLQGYQRAYTLFLNGQYISPHKLIVGIAYDYNSSIYQSTTINPTNFSSPTPSSFGVPSAPFGTETNVESWRIFFARQRCSAFQLTINEVFDPSMGTAAGAGLTLSGMNAVVALKKGWKTISSAHSAGGGQNRG